MQTLLPNPFESLPYALNDARAELLASQAELHTLRVKSGKGKIMPGGVMIQRATSRLYKALDGVRAAQERSC